MMKLNDKTKRWLIIAACGLFCAALVSLIGARFIPQAPIDKPTSSGEDTQEVSPTAEVPEKQEEKEVVIIPEPRPEPVSEAAAISTGTEQTIQPDPVIPSESEKPVAQGDHTDPNQQPIYKPEDTSKPSPQSAPQNGDTSGGIPSVDDKLVQEVMRMILESIYEPNFSNLSHGFRPKRSCHTALMHVQRHFTGVKWFIEGDIKGFFDNINHQTMVSILRKRIKDEYFLGLIWKFLKAGYLEDWTFHNTYSGTPQGSVISPILSNIYLNELDRYIEEYTESFNKGKVRAGNSEYSKIRSKIGRLTSGKYSNTNWDKFSDEEKEQAASHLKQLYDELYQYTRTDPMDDGYKRLVYVRYADDWLCGVIGSKDDAEIIKADIKQFLSEKLQLELSDEKTLITNAQEKARFLGYDISAYADAGFIIDKNGRKMRSRNSKIKLLVPHEKWQKKLTAYKAMQIQIDENGKEKYQPVHRPHLIRNDDIEILTQYNAEIRGLYNYYRLANNVSVLNTFGYIL